jgi:hypothetical protein
MCEFKYFSQRRYEVWNERPSFDSRQGQELFLRHVVHIASEENSAYRKISFGGYSSREVGPYAALLAPLQLHLILITAEKRGMSKLDVILKRDLLKLACECILFPSLTIKKNCT